MVRSVNYFKYISIVLFIVFFSLHHIYGEYEPSNDFDYDLASERLKKTATKEYFEEHINNGLKQENIDDTQMYFDLAKLIEIEINKDVIAEFEEKTTLIKSSIRNTTDFTAGMITGEGETTSGMTGAIASDFLVIGDIRDLGGESIKLLKGEDYDEFVLMLSAIGIGLTVSTAASSGGMFPMKVGGSILKASKKLGYLSKGLVKDIYILLKKTVDISILKKQLTRVDFTSQKSIRLFSRNVMKSIQIKNIKKVFLDLSLIKKSTSIIGAMHVIKYAKNIKDIKVLRKAAVKFKGDTKGILKVIGVKGVKGVVKVSKFIMYYIIALLATLLSWAYSIGSYLVLRKVKQAVFTP